MQKITTISVKVIVKAMIGLISNISLYIWLYILMGNRISLEINPNTTIIIVVLSLLLIILIFIAKRYWGSDYKQVTLSSCSALFYSLLFINIISVMRLFYNLLKYEDIILSTKFFRIHFHYTKEELQSMVPIFYKEIKGVAKIFTEEQQQRIANGITSSAELKNKICELIKQEQEQKWNLMQIVQPFVDFYNTHPYITGLVVTGICVILGYTIYKNYEYIIHWNQTKRTLIDLNNRVTTNLEEIGVLRGRVQQVAGLVKKEDESIRSIVVLVWKLIGNLNLAFEVEPSFALNQPRMSGINIRNLEIVRKNLEELIIRIFHIYGKIEGREMEHNNLANPEPFRPFSGRGYQLGEE